MAHDVVDNASEIDEQELIAEYARVLRVTPEQAAEELSGTPTLRQIEDAATRLQNTPDSELTTPVWLTFLRELSHGRSRSD